MPLTLAALKTELTTDPRGYGYNAAARNDSDMMERINRKRDGGAGNVPTTPLADGGVASGIIKLNNLTVDAGLIRASVTKAAYDGLAATERTWLNFFISNGTIVPKADNITALCGTPPGEPTSSAAVWSAATRAVMNPAMEALMRKVASRAEEKFGIGVQVTLDEIGSALNS